MSWWVYLEDADGESVTVSNHAEGGTHVVGGTDAAELNVTYNYGDPIRKAEPGIDDFRGFLNGARAMDVTDRLAKVVEALGTERDADYWKPTPGNAGYALSILLGWAKQHPEAIFRVS